MTLQVKTGLSAIKLCQGKNAIHNENNLKVMSKVAKMEHATKTGFIVGPIFCYLTQTCVMKK